MEQCRVDARAAAFGHGENGEHSHFGMRLGSVDGLIDEGKLVCRVFLAVGNLLQLSFQAFDLLTVASEFLQQRLSEFLEQSVDKDS